MKFLFALLVAGFGIACLNYTAFGNHEHHVEWAADAGMPAPSTEIFLGGAAAAVLGGFLLGRASKRTVA